MLLVDLTTLSTQIHISVPVHLDGHINKSSCVGHHCLELLRFVDVCQDNKASKSYDDKVYIATQYYIVHKAVQS